MLPGRVYKTNSSSTNIDEKNNIFKLVSVYLWCFVSSTLNKDIYKRKQSWFLAKTLLYFLLFLLLKHLETKQSLKIKRPLGTINHLSHPNQELLCFVFSIELLCLYLNALLDKGFCVSEWFIGPGFLQFLYMKIMYSC